MQRVEGGGGGGNRVSPPREEDGARNLDKADKDGQREKRKSRAWQTVRSAGDREREKESGKESETGEGGPAGSRGGVRMQVLSEL